MSDKSAYGVHQISVNAHCALPFDKEQRALIFVDHAQDTGVARGALVLSLHEAARLNAMLTAWPEGNYTGKVAAALDDSWPITVDQSMKELSQRAGLEGLARSFAVARYIAGELSPPASSFFIAGSPPEE